MKTPVLQTLIASGICFAVSVSDNFFKNKAEYHTRKEFYIICKSSQRQKGLTQKNLMDYGFILDEKTRLYEYKMTDEEIALFKEEQDLFVKVLHNEYGRIYELKGKEFKKFYKI